MTGRIIKSIGGFFYVYVPDDGMYVCRAKGIFRKDNIRPVAGDLVEMTVTHEGDREGNIDKILPRKNFMIRPAVANIDQAIIVFAMADPAPNFPLEDKFLVTAESKGIECAVCFNKSDLASKEDRKRFKERFEKTGYPVIFTDALTGEGIEELFDILDGKTTTLAGPSGVGKSTLINLLCEKADMETGSVSRKIGRGRHTTRHSELFPIEKRPGSFILDTPGFTSLLLDGIEKENLETMFPEFEPYLGKCRFRGCSHIKEPGCAIREALSGGNINEERYVNYGHLYEELKNKKKY